MLGSGPSWAVGSEPIFGGKNLRPLWRENDMKKEVQNLTFKTSQISPEPDLTALTYVSIHLCIERSIYLHSSWGPTSLSWLQLQIARVDRARHSVWLQCFASPCPYNLWHLCHSAMSDWALMCIARPKFVSRTSVLQLPQTFWTLRPRNFRGDFRILRIFCPTGYSKRKTHRLVIRPTPHRATNSRQSPELDPSTLDLAAEVAAPDFVFYNGSWGEFAFMFSPR